MKKIKGYHRFEGFECQVPSEEQIVKGAITAMFVFILVLLVVVFGGIILLT